ncbi:19380_t:CDS:2 [Entrophospora sp. SA101]|nr:19380_t:CDS:2 [Entrophospora sp. SA101]
MSQINVSDILPLLSLIAILMWFSISSIKNYFNGDLTTRDANILNFIRQRFTEENILYDSKLTEGLAKLNAELNARDANFTAEAQRILSLINSFTTRLDEIEQVLERYNNHFGRISSEFDSINESIESITTFQNPLINVMQSSKESNKISKVKRTYLKILPIHTIPLLILILLIPLLVLQDQSQRSFSGITLTIWTRFKQIFDREMAQRRYTFDEMCYSVAMRIQPLDILCGASAVYLTIENDTLPPLENVRDIVDRAVNSSLLKIEENERKTKVLEVLSQVSGYISVRGLKAFNVLNMERELPLDYTREKIEENIINLKYKLEHPRSEVDINLYGSLRQALENINSSELTWRDPEASMVLSNDSDIVKNLQPRQKNVFLEPRENMKCIIPESIKAKCNEFVSGFNNSNTLHDTRNIFHDKSWKESESKLMEITGHILSTLGEIWSNPAFMSSVSRSEQSEGTYISDIIMPLLRSSLGDLLNDQAISHPPRNNYSSTTISSPPYNKY